MMKIQHISEDAVAHLIMVAMSNVLITIIPLSTTNYVACGGQLHHLRASFEQLELFDVPQWPFAQFGWRRSHGSLKAAWQSSACWWWTLLTVFVCSLWPHAGAVVSMAVMFRWAASSNTNGWNGCCHFLGHNTGEAICLVQYFSFLFAKKASLCASVLEKAVFFNLSIN